MLLVPTVQCWSYRSLFSRSGFSKESLEQIKQNLVLHRNEIWRVRFCECIYYKYFLNACILTYVSFEGRQNQIRKHIQHNRSYNFHRLKSVSRNPTVKGVPPPPPPCLDGWECFKKLWGSHCSNLLVLFSHLYSSPPRAQIDANYICELFPSHLCW